MVEVSLVVAFVAGLVSFVSPCILPIIPGFLAYLSGTSVGEKPNKIKMLLNSVSFVLGFSVIFALLGVLLNTVLERVSYSVQNWLSMIGGAVIIVFAFYILGLIRIPFFEREHKLAVKKKFSITYITSFVFGAAFAVGWTPCVSAILGSILALAVSKPALSFLLLLSYALGLGIPFLIVGLFSSQATALINKSTTVLKYFNIVVGILLLLLGILVFTNKLNLVANLFVPASFLK